MVSFRSPMFPSMEPLMSTNVTRVLRKKLLSTQIRKLRLSYTRDVVYAKEDEERDDEIHSHFPFISP